jgi:hypothetical protein
LNYNYFGFSSKLTFVFVLNSAKKKSKVKLNANIIPQFLALLLHLSSAEFLFLACYSIGK